MNVIGHPYVAGEALGYLTPQLVLGSYLPDIVPFVSDSVFTFEEIHQSGEQFLRYLEREAPEQQDLALGMLAHQRADQFSTAIEDKFADYRDEYAREISKASVIDLEVARKSRYHNFLWWGVDLQLLWNRREHVLEIVDTVREINDEIVSGAALLLAGCFKKSVQGVADNITTLLEPMDPERFLTADGLAMMWKEIAAGLPENDQVDPARTAVLFKKFAFLVGREWDGIVNDVVVAVHDYLDQV